MERLKYASQVSTQDKCRVDDCEYVGTVTEFYQREHDVLADLVCSGHTGRFVHLWPTCAVQPVIGEVHFQTKEKE